MPNVHQLASNGMVYTNAWSEFGHTQASFETLFESEWIIELKNRDYFTVGINYNAYLTKLTGYDFGFDYFHDIASNPEKVFMDDSKDINQVFYDFLLSDGYTEPIFVWLHYMDCHTPYYPNEWTPKMLLADCGSPIAPITKKVIRELKASYEYAVSYLDRNIGELLMDLDDNAIIIISADHGEEFYEHGKFGHDASRTCVEVLHIPLIVKGHGVGVNKEKILFRDIKNLILK